MNISIFYSSVDYLQMVDIRAYLCSVIDPKEDQVWFDGNIPPGGKWPQAIMERLHETDLAVLCISPSFAKSRFIREVEQPATIVRKRRGELAEWLPILVAPWKEVKGEDGMLVTNLLFRRRNRLVPFGKLRSDEKINKLHEAVERARRSAGRLNKNAGSIRPSKKRAVDLRHLNLLSSIGQSQGAKEVARSFARDPEGSIKCALRSYLTLRRVQLDGVEFAREWGERLVERFRGQALKPQYKAILRLMSSGPPDCPLHLESFAAIDLNTNLLMRPGIAALLNGLRTMESNYQAAADLITATRHQNCALAHCALAQCYRKRNEYTHAEASLSNAIRLAGAMGMDCSCGLGCPQASIMAEAHRCLGTLRRKTGKCPEAKAEFEAALSWCDRSGVAAGQTSGVMYSFGYFLLEWAITCWGGSSAGVVRPAQIVREGFGRLSEPSEEAKARLEEAEKLFLRADELKRETGPALSRLGIVRELLGPGSGDIYFVRGKNAAEGSEGPLTRFFCEVGIFLQIVDAGSAPDIQDVHRVADELLEHFFGVRMISEGARECHAFDLQVVLRRRDLRRVNERLDRAARLLIDSASWDRLHSVEEQHARTRSFLEKYDASEA